MCASQVWLLPSFSDEQRAALLAACVAVLYTPQNEHFGIVPLEAMASGRPVIACDSGGPTESVLPGVTGFLCRPSPSQFADAMGKLLVQSDVTKCGILHVAADVKLLCLIALPTSVSHVLILVICIRGEHG